MLDHATVPDLGIGPYGVEHDAADGFFYLTLHGTRAGKSYPLGKTAYRTARKLNDEHTANQPFAPEAPIRRKAPKAKPAPEEPGIVVGYDLSKETRKPDPNLVVFTGTREEWLNAFVAAARPEFEKVGTPLTEKVRVSIGWTVSRKAAGECWSDEASADGVREIFLAPDRQDSREVAGILTHELCHAALPFGHKHDKVFKQLGNALGLVGKPKQLLPDFADPDSLWAAWADPILAKLGPIPHAKLDRSLSGVKKQKTRLLKGECKDCGFTVRLTAKWVNKAEGALQCPDSACGGELHVTIEGGDGEGE